MKRILTAVINRLQEQVPELTWIDVNLGQMNLENPVVEYPCALVNIPTIKYSNMGNRIQTGEVNIEIELYLQTYTTPNTDSSLEHFSSVMELLDITNNVYKALEGLSGENFGSLNRRLFTHDKKIQPRAIVLNFACNLTDNSASPVYTPIANLKPIISQELI